MTPDASDERMVRVLTARNGHCPGSRFIGIRSMDSTVLRNYSLPFPLVKSPHRDFERGSNAARTPLEQRSLQIRHPVPVNHGKLRGGKKMREVLRFRNTGAMLSRATGTCVRLAGRDKEHFGMVKCRNIAVLEPRNEDSQSRHHCRRRFACSPAASDFGRS